MPGAVFTFKQLAIPRRCTLKSASSVGPLPKSADTVGLLPKSADTVGLLPKSADTIGLFPKSSDTIKLVFLCTETDYVFRLGGLGTPTAASMVFHKRRTWRNNTYKRKSTFHLHLLLGYFSNVSCPY